MSGSGLRFKNAGYLELKPFIPVNGAPLISHILEMYPDVESPLFILNDEDEDLERHIDVLLRLRPKGQIAKIPKKRSGPSWAVLAAKEFVSLEKPVIVNYCDFAGVWDLGEMANKLLAGKNCILTYTGFHPHMLRNVNYAYTHFSGEFVDDIREKIPYTETPMNEQASSGAYGFTSGRLLIEAIESQIQQGLSLNDEFYTSLTYIPILQAELPVVTTLMKKFYQWGTPEDLEDFKYWQEIIMKIDNKQSVQFSSKRIETKGTNIILAAGSGSRVRHISNYPKILIPISNIALWEYSLLGANELTNNLLLTRTEFAHLINLEDSRIEIVFLDTPTQGQADTARIGLNRIEEKEYPVSILSSDNLVLDVSNSQIVLTILPNSLVVWVAANYQIANNNSEQYSWVNVNENHEVVGVSTKSKPLNSNSKMIIGNFTFSSTHLAEKLIEQLIQDKKTINGEYYLDSIIEIAISTGVKVELIESKLFCALGTADELKTWEYWQDCLDKKYISWKK
jgi:NDP-sugar pyrophosphorylase family protein